MALEGIKHPSKQASEETKAGPVTTVRLSYPALFAVLLGSPLTTVQLDEIQEMLDRKRTTGRGRKNIPAGTDVFVSYHRTLYPGVVLRRSGKAQFLHVSMLDGPDRGRTIKFHHSSVFIRDKLVDMNTVIPSSVQNQLNEIMPAYRPIRPNGWDPNKRRKKKIVKLFDEEDLQDLESLKF